MTLVVETATVPATAVLPGPVKVNVEVVMVDGSIDSLKTAVTVVAMEAPVAPLVGITEETVGTGPAAVVNVNELALAIALPVAATTPVVTTAVYIVLGASGAFGVSVAVNVVES